mgnify:CR=1 FL=1
MRSAKIVPILHKPETLEIGSYVRINNIDDDMYNKKGIFKGHYNHPDGIRSWIVLDENNKNFYTRPENIEKIFDCNYET